MRRTKLLCTHAITIAVFAATPAYALESSGYLRSGVELGGNNACFKLPEAKSKFRLGNECEQYGEVDLRHAFSPLPDGSVLTLEGMVALLSEYGHAPTFSGEHGYTRLSQAFAQWGRVPYLNGGTVWAGRRYYRRNSVHISDFYYWNQSATGGGVENVGIGGLLLSYAFSEKDNVLQRNAINRHDVNVGNIETNSGGTLELGFSYIQNPHLGNTHAGWSVALQHKQVDFLGGANTFALQYGRGPGMGLGGTGNVALNRNNTAFRILDYFDWQAGDRFSGQITAVYERDKFDDGSEQKWISVGMRPVFAVAPHIKLAIEVGHDRVIATDGLQTLTKVTCATIWSPAGPGFWTRPEIRLYYTHAHWNGAAQRAADFSVPGSTLSSTGPYGSRFDGDSVGIQVEYWWP